METHTGTNEFGMIEEARPFEHSGPYFALLRWGSAMKQLILYTILLNVFIAPWGLAASAQAGAVLLAIVALVAKAAALGVIVATIDNSFAKLRLFKITEFVAARVPARRARCLHPLPGRWLMAVRCDVAPPGVFSGSANVIAVGVLLLEFGMFRQALLRDQVRLYAAQSALISVLAVVVAAARHLPELYVLAALSFALKVVIVPVVLRRLLRGLAPAARARGGRTSRAAARWAWPAPCCWPSPWLRSECSAWPRWACTARCCRGRRSRSRSRWSWSPSC